MITEGTKIKVIVMNGTDSTLPTRITVKTFDTDNGRYIITGHDNRLYMFPITLTVIITEI